MVSVGVNGPHTGAERGGSPLGVKFRRAKFLLIP